MSGEVNDRRPVDERSHPGGSEVTSYDEDAVALVMDVGGSWTRAGLATRKGELVWRDRVRTESDEGRTAVIARMEELVDVAISQAGRRTVGGIGIGVAGPVDPDTGMIYNPPNNPGLDGVSFKSLWGDRMKWPVLVANDATLAALGEYRYGVGAGARTLVYLTVSTGIGGGVVVDGRPLMGAHGMAGELGHMSIDRRGARCNCGNVGCLESFASGTAIANAARRLAAERGNSMVREMVSGELDRVSAEMVFAAAAGGDGLASEVLEDAARALGAGLVNVLHIFDPGRDRDRRWSFQQLGPDGVACPVLHRGSRHEPHTEVGLQAAGELSGRRYRPPWRGCAGVGEVAGSP